MLTPLQTHVPSLLLAQRTEVEQALPWPQGSLLSGKLVADADGKGVMLLLGRYRLRAEVPPNTSLGHVWLQVLKHGAPAQLRLLSQAQVESLLANLLQQKDEAKAAKPLLSQHGAWSKLDGDVLPFVVEPHGQYATLLDKEHEAPQGMLCEARLDNGAFKLSGRLDLPQLGASSFMLHGDKRHWKLDIHIANASLKQMMTKALQDWLETRQNLTTPLQVAWVDTPCELGHRLNQRV